jgi:hypothetical protein
MKWKEAVHIYFKVLSQHSSGRNGENPKHVGRDIRCPDRNWNQTTPLDQTRSVSLVLFTWHNDRIKAYWAIQNALQKNKREIFQGKELTVNDLVAVIGGSY